MPTKFEKFQKKTDEDLKKDIEKLKMNIARSRNVPISKRKSQVESFTNRARSIVPKKPSKEELDINRIISPKQNISLPNAEISKAVRRPINKTERMWVVSDWENRKQINPDFDVDNWFQSSTYLEDTRNQEVSDFWEGRGRTREAKIENEKKVEDFWLGRRG